MNLFHSEVDSLEAWIEDARSPEWRCSPKCRSINNGEPRPSVKSSSVIPGGWSDPIWNPIWLNRCSSWSLLVGLGRRWEMVLLANYSRSISLTPSPALPSFFPSVESTWTFYNCLIVPVLLPGFYFVDEFSFSNEVEFTFLLLIFMSEWSLREVYENRVR